MREIKFRAWDGKHYGEMVNVDVICFAASSAPMPSRPDAPYLLDEHNDVYFLDECALMQFTGLRDRNGVEIYEGDIVRCHQHQGWYCESKVVDTVGVIVWQEKAARFGMRVGNQVNTPMKLHVMHRPEVIGNIYENPDLLAGE